MNHLSDVRGGGLECDPPGLAINFLAQSVSSFLGMAYIFIRMNGGKTAKFPSMDRMIFPDLEDIKPREARSLLSVKFSKHDRTQINDLVGLAQAGRLDDEQSAVPEGYLRLGNVLTMLHSKARTALKRTAAPRQRRKSA